MAGTGDIQGQGYFSKVLKNGQKTRFLGKFLGFRNFAISDLGAPRSDDPRGNIIMDFGHIGSSYFCCNFSNEAYSHTVGPTKSTFFEKTENKKSTFLKNSPKHQRQDPGGIFVNFAKEFSTRAPRGGGLCGNWRQSLLVLPHSN